MARKKATRKKAARKKTTRRSAASAAAKPPTKSEVFTSIADATGLSKRDVSAVFDTLGGVIQKSLKKHQAFTLPGLAKLVVKKKPATKARKGINPFTGEEMMFKAKPASKQVKIRPLKNLKEMV